jgi:hypothetical protein
MNPDETARITYYWRDDDLAVGTHQVRATRDLAGASAYAVGLAPLLPPVSSCALERIRVGLRYLDETDPAPAGGSSVYRRSIFIFETAQGDRYLLSLPGVVASALLPPPDPYAGVRLDLANVAVAALVAGLLTGLGSTRPCAPWGPGEGGDLAWQGDDLVNIAEAYWGYERAGW